PGARPRPPRSARSPHRAPEGERRRRKAPAKGGDGAGTSPQSYRLARRRDRRPRARIPTPVTDRAITLALAFVGAALCLAFLQSISNWAVVVAAAGAVTALSAVRG